MTADTAALFDAAQSAISEVIANGQVLALNETETRTHLIDPVLAALGYQSLDTVRREHRLPASGQVIDYLLTAGEHRIAVEAKSVGTELAAREGSQLVGYAAQEGIRWALLTNGLHWQIYDIEASGDWASKKVVELDLMAAAQGGTLAQALVSLSHFAIESLKVDDSALRAYVFEERARRYLDSALANSSSRIVGSIVEDMAQAGIEVTPEDIVALLRKGTAVPTGPVMPAVPASDFDFPKNTSDQGFYVFPAADVGSYSALDHLKLWLAKGFWGVGASTPHRTNLKAGDRCCFYAKGNGPAGRPYKS